MESSQYMEILKQAIANDYKGSVSDLFRKAEQQELMQSLQQEQPQQMATGGYVEGAADLTQTMGVKGLIKKGVSKATNLLGFASKGLKPFMGVAGLIDPTKDASDMPAMWGTGAAGDPYSTEALIGGTNRVYKSGGLVQSYQSTPPSMTNLPIGREIDPVEENLGQYKKGGYYDDLKPFDEFYKAKAKAKKNKKKTFTFEGTVYSTSTEKPVDSGLNVKLKHGGLHPTPQDAGIKKEEEGYGDRGIPYKSNIPMDSLLNRQLFTESSFNPKAVSPANAIGLSQITEQTFEYMQGRGWVPEGAKFQDLKTNTDLSIDLQQKYMEDLMNRPWNSQEKSANETVRRAKALAAYNMGPPKLVNTLNKMKDDGYDIYSGLDWIKDLPKYHRTKTNKPIYESKNYVNKILFQGDKTFEEGYKKKYEEVGKSYMKHGGMYKAKDILQYKNGGEKVTIDPNVIANIPPHLLKVSQESQGKQGTIKPTDTSTRNKIYQGIKDLEHFSLAPGGKTKTVSDDDISAMNFAPISGEIIDAKNVVKNVATGDYGEAALHSAGLLLPFVPGGLVKKGYQKVKDLIKGSSKKPSDFKNVNIITKSKPSGKNTDLIEDPHSLYRVVDVPFGSKIDEVTKAAEYGTTIPKVPTTGRRTGYSQLQRETPFDVLSTTSDQSWILGSGSRDHSNLINLYGRGNKGGNPYIIKMGRGNPLVGPESVSTIKKRTDALNFQFPYTQNVGKWNKGKFDLPLELGGGVYTTLGKSVDDLAKIPPGSIVNPNFVSRGANITTIFGPKGTQVRNPQGILSKNEYLKLLRDNPNYKFKKGGTRKKLRKIKNKNK